MEAIRDNLWGAAGALLGAIALVMSIFHVTLGPFSVRPSVASVVAEQVFEVKKGILAGLKGEQPAPQETRGRPVNIDRVLDNTSLGLAFAALLCAFIAGVRRERRWIVGAALLCGGGTLAFHAVLYGIAVVFAILFLLIVIGLLGGLS